MIQPVGKPPEVSEGRESCDWGGDMLTGEQVQD